MPDTKISDLAAASALTGSEQLAGVQSSTTKKVTAAQLATYIAGGAANNVAITGGAINGTPIGGSTAAAGAFTTLSASDDVNFDSGTLFVDASADFVGIGTASPGAIIHAIKSAAAGTPAFGANDVGVFQNTATTSSPALFKVISGSAAAASVYFGDENNSAVGSIRYENSSNSMHFYTQFTERVAILNSGEFGIGTSSPTEMLDVNGDAIRVRSSQTPASASATGDAGMIAWDSNYIYVCTATNTWTRSALSTW